MADHDYVESSPSNTGNCMLDHDHGYANSFGQEPVQLGKKRYSIGEYQRQKQIVQIKPREGHICKKWG